MKEQCFDAGTIQAFLDGELSSDLLENVARHVAVCDDCAVLLSEAEDESAFAFSLLDEELNTLVPSERIRAGVYQAISQITRPKFSLWERLLAVTSAFANPTVAAFASVIILFTILAIVYGLRNQTSVSNVTPIVAVAPTQEQKELLVDPAMTSTPEKVEVAPKRAGFDGTEKVVFHPGSKRKKQPRIPKNDGREPKNGLPSLNIDGESTYLKTIATLEKTVDDKKESILRASSRVSYERDMAIINDSIKRMREEVRRNPKNEAAKQILRNSYQNKIELLNSVSDRSELMASLD